jgi:predicted PP-loop superfamily ATPase
VFSATSGCLASPQVAFMGVKIVKKIRQIATSKPMRLTQHAISVQHSICNIVGIKFKFADLQVENIMKGSRYIKSLTQL